MNFEFMPELKWPTATTGPEPDGAVCRDPDGLFQKARLAEVSGSC